jgi:DNA replication protein DnaC
MEMKDLVELLKVLKFTGMQETLAARVKEARDNSLDYEQFLGLLLQDEQEVRNARSLCSKVNAAKFEETKTLEGLDLRRYSSEIRRVINHLSTGSYLREKKNVIILGPTGTGKTHLAQGLGHDACRRGKKVKFIRSNSLIAEFNASRTDDSWQSVLNKYTRPDLLILDDFGLKALSHSGASDLYELIATKHINSNFIITSNRKTEGWCELFPDQVIACAALDRIVHNSYVILLDSEDTFRKNFTPKLPKEDCKK